MVCNPSCQAMYGTLCPYKKHQDAWSSSTWKITLFKSSLISYRPHSDSVTKCTFWFSSFPYNQRLIHNPAALVTQRLLDILVWSQTWILHPHHQMVRGSLSKHLGHLGLQFHDISLNHRPVVGFGTEEKIRKRYLQSLSRHLQQIHLHHQDQEEVWWTWPNPWMRVGLRVFQPSSSSSIHNWKGKKYPCNEPRAS